MSRPSHSAHACGALAVLLVATACSSPARHAARSVVRRPSTISTWAWPSYGHDAQHTFAGRTTLTKTSLNSLRKAWLFPTGDAVTATPTVVSNTVYAGSWDGNFYAVDLRTGKLRWKYALEPQPAVEPRPGQVPRPGNSDGGLVTSSAWFEPATTKHPDLIVFGGGYTLYALDAVRGSLYWRHDYTGRPEHRPDPAKDNTRIFSSPVVIDGKVIVGVSPDGNEGRRGYIVAADVVTGSLVWRFETDVDASGRILNDGCGGVWSSGSLLPRPRLVVFDTSDCGFSNRNPLDEAVMALHVRDGKLAWMWRPTRKDVHCDFDFGATPNVGLDPNGNASFLGVGGKDGTYYSLDPAIGKQRWSTNVVFGGFAGGFIGTTAYDGARVFGSTALGDFGRFEGAGEVFCAKGNPRDLPTQEPTVHAFDARGGDVAWQARQAASFAPTTVAGGMTFNGVGLRQVVHVRDAETGRLLREIPIPALCWSGIATVGNAIIFGTGASHQGAPDGIEAFTPNGGVPSTPVG